MSRALEKHDSRFLLALAVFCLPLAAGSGQQATPDSDDPWTKRLQSSDYLVQKLAEEKICATAEDHADALLLFRESDDVHLALLAERMLLTHAIPLTIDGDQLAIQQWLRGYSQQPLEVRQMLVQHLAAIESESSSAALTRIARWELSEDLATEAAISLIERLGDNVVIARRSTSDNAAPTGRKSIRWLRICLLDSSDRDPSKFLGIEMFVQAELERAARRGIQRLDRQNVQRLVQWLIDRQLNVHRVAQADAFAHQMLPLVPLDDSAISAQVSWLCERELLGAAQQLYQQHAERFDANPLLLYQAAELYWLQGDVDYARQLAARADEVAVQIQPARSIWALQLQRMGLPRWAEAHYRAQLSEGDPRAVESIRVNLCFANLLEDQVRYAEAAEILDRCVSRFDEPDYQDRFCRAARRTDRELQCQLEYLKSCAAKSAGDEELRTLHLLRAAEWDPHCTSVLIDLYAVSREDRSLQGSVDTLITAALHELQNEIDATVDLLQNEMEAGTRTGYEHQLGLLYNRWSWLAANTQRFPRESLRRAKLALRLVPDQAAFWDTLARCHFAAGEISRAIAAQRKAIAEDPHGQALQRQLEYYQRMSKSQSVAGLIE